MRVVDPLAPQQLTQRIQVTTNAAGTFAGEFPPVQTGYTWTGTISVPSAPSAAVFQWKRDGLVIQSWPGSSPTGPCEANSGSVVSVVGSGLAPTATYTVIWVGQSRPGGLAGIMPTPLAGFQQISLGGNLFVEVSGAAGSGTHGTTTTWTPAIPATTTVSAFYALLYTPTATATHLPSILVTDAVGNIIFGGNGPPVKGAFTQGYATSGLGVVKAKGPFTLSWTHCGAHAIVKAAVWASGVP